MTSMRERRAGLTMPADSVGRRRRASSGRRQSRRGGGIGYEPLEPRAMLSGDSGMVVAQSVSTASVELSEAETLLMYLVNRTRRYPEQWATRLSVSLPSDQVGPFSPLVTNSSLLQASRLHSEEMLSRTTLSHYGANGSSPFDRAVLAGYPSRYVGENVGYDWNFPSYTADAIASRMNDGWFKSSGHRANMLTADWTEFGGAFAVRQPPNGTQYATELFGKNDAGPFLTGVVFVDRNADLDYDAGEGLGNVMVTATGTAGIFTTTTPAAGGWALKVPAGQYTVTASGGGFSGRGSTTVTVGTRSVAVDFLSGRANAWVNFEEQNGGGGQPGTGMPLAPTGVVATAGSGQASLSWTAPAVASGVGPVTNYVVQSSRDNGATWTTFARSSVSTVPSAVVTGLANGTRYVFRVAAVNATGTGAYSGASNAVIPGASNPTNPTSPSPAPTTLRASVTGPSAAVAEGGVATFTITLSQASTKAVQVGYQTASGSATAGRDFRATTGFVTFAPGETVKTVLVSTINDVAGEADEWFSLQLVRRPGPAYVGTGSARATIADDDGGRAVTMSMRATLAAAVIASQQDSEPSSRKSSVVRV